jgi:hypothetical protein
MSKGGEGGEA